MLGPFHSFFHELSQHLYEVGTITIFIAEIGETEAKN